MKDLFDDTPFHTLSRSNDPQTSKDAAKTVNSGNDRAELLAAIQQAETKGLTLKEYCTKRGYQMSSKSSRCTELKKLGLVVYLGDKRDGARVIRDSSYKNSTMEIT